MRYNIDFEICSLAYLLITFIYYFLKRKYFDYKGKVYVFYLIFVFLDITINLISIFTIAHANEIPLIINLIVNSLYMACQFTMPSILYLYIISTSKGTKSSINLLSLIPLLLGLLAVIVNPVFHNLFYFDQNNLYMLGNGQWQLYINAAFYLLLTLYHSIKERKNLGNIYFNTYIGITTIMILGLILQFLYPSLLITGTGAVISSFMLYLAIENPDNYSDNITECLNRRALTAKLEELYAHKDSQNIIIISLKNFRVINDIFDMHIGDLLLKEVGSCLQKIGGKNTVFRLHGDVFAMISPVEKDFTSQIEACFKNDFTIEHFSIRLSARICVLVSDHFQSYQEMIQMIDLSVQGMKNLQENKAYFIDHETKYALHYKNTIIMETKQALENPALGHQKIQVYYQPILDTDGHVTELEALIRFHSNQYGYIPAEEFISICEQNGTIIEIGQLVIRNVCQFLNTHASLFEDDLKISVNLSVVQLTQPHFFEEIRAILEEYQIESQQLIFEITESSALYSHATLMKNVCDMADYGFLLSMDDYGTGYASINNMMSLPISIVKIDKSIVQAAIADKKAFVILEHTIKMLLELDFLIVCEGIETKEQLEKMTVLGVPLFQGYYFSKPVNEETIIEFLQKKNR